MSFLKNILKAKEAPVQTANDFWSWFLKNEQFFYKVIKEQGDVERDFFNKLSPKLNELHEGFWFMAGMHDDFTAELILTVDGSVKDIVFAEELVLAAPLTDRWKFTALKPALDLQDVNIEMDDYKFNQENLSFYANDLPTYADEIDITIIHDDYAEENKDQITTGVYIFLDNYLGELDFATTIDNLKVTSGTLAGKELIPIGKLRNYLLWRGKEFIEKYEGIRRDDENDRYVSLEAELDGGDMLIAVVNSDLLDWEQKASHPWILTLTISYDVVRNHGMPNKETYDLLDKFEERIIEGLKELGSSMYIGRQTAKGEREIYFACNDFRKPSKVVWNIRTEYAKQLKVTYEINKDKYWQSFNRFISS